MPGSRPSTGSRAESASSRAAQRSLPPLSGKTKGIPAAPETPGAGAAQPLPGIIDCDEEGEGGEDSTPELPWGSAVYDWIGKAPGASSRLRRHLRKVYLPVLNANMNAQMSNWFTMNGFGLPYLPRAELMVQLMVSILGGESRRTNYTEYVLLASSLRSKHDESTWLCMADLVERHLVTLDLSKYFLTRGTFLPPWKEKVLSHVLVMYTVHHRSLPAHDHEHAVFAL